MGEWTKQTCALCGIRRPVQYMERKLVDSGKLGAGIGVSPFGRKKQGAVARTVRIHSSRKRKSMRWCCADSAACNNPQYYVQKAKREAEQARLDAIRIEEEKKRKAEEDAKKALLLAQKKEYQSFRKYFNEKLAGSFLKSSEITEEFLSIHKRKRQDRFYYYQKKLKTLLNSLKKIINGNTLTDGSYELIVKTFYESCNLSSSKYGMNNKFFSIKKPFALPKGYIMLSFSFGIVFLTAYAIGIILSYITYPNLEHSSAIISLLIALLITFTDNKLYGKARHAFREIEGYINQEQQYLSNFYAAVHHPIVTKQLFSDSHARSSFCQYDTFTKYSDKYIEEIFGKESDQDIQKLKSCVEDSSIEEDDISSDNNKNKFQEVDEIWKTKSEAWTKKHYISLFNRDDFLELCSLFLSSQVALADKTLQDEEKEFIRNLEGIENIRNFILPSKEPSIKTLAQLINKKYKLDDKLDLINTLFAMAESDGILKNEEIELIRKISDLLEIPSYKYEEIKNKSISNIAEARAKEEAAIIEQEAIDDEFSDVDFDDDE